MRAVLDTNILARAARGGAGPAAEVVRNLLGAPNVLILSLPLVSELGRTLRYPRLRKMHGLDDAGIDVYEQQLQAGAHIVNPPAGLPAAIVTHDPGDDPVIAAAICGQAQVVCTRDHHFRHPDVQAYCSLHGIQILDDLELLRLLRAAGGQQAIP